MPSSKVILKGKKVIDRDVPFLTPNDIRAHLEKMVRSDQMIVIARGRELRPLHRMPGDFNLGSEVNAKTIPRGTVKGAMSKRERYIKAQVASVAEVYGERYGQAVQLDERLQFVVIPCFTLPKQWGYKITPILIWFPEAYPDVPPDGFYLSNQCRGPHVFSRPVGGHSNSPDLSDKGWNWFCVHPSWHADPDPNEEDNLWTFLNVAKVSFTIDEF
jgi:hypothetical protein